MHFDPSHLSPARFAAKPRRVGVRRVVRDVDRRHPRGVVLRRRRVPDSRRTEHEARLRPRARRERRRAPWPTSGRPLYVLGRRRGARDRGYAAALSPPPSRQAGARRRSPTSISAAGRGSRRSAACARAASGSRRSRCRRAKRCTGSARNSARSTSADSSSIRTSSMLWASTRARRTRTSRSRGARGSATAHGAFSSTRRGR